MFKPNWPVPSHIRAVTTLRTGGYSQAPYDSFNLADHVGDDPKMVAKNRQKLYESLKLQNPPFWLNQVHGDGIIHWQDELPDNATADAIFTSKKHHPCAVLTGDCLPILLCDRIGSVVAAIHAGWKGLLNGVIEATVNAMPVPSDTLLAWIGPAIGPAVFEVGEAVKTPFTLADSLAENAFQPYKKEKFLCDIFLLGKQRLNSAGVTAIYGGYECTYSNPERFFSARRSQNTGTGRFATLIWME